MIRIDGPTPNGGVYSEIYYYDENGQEVGPENAVIAYGCEFDAQGKTIKETHFVRNPKTEGNHQMLNSDQNSHRGK